MADDRGIKFSKVLNGIVGLLLAIVGYFLVGRDSEVRTSMAELWKELAQIRQQEAEIHTTYERLSTESKWLLEQGRDRELRLRKLEQSCWKP